MRNFQPFDNSILFIGHRAEDQRIANHIRPSTLEEALTAPSSVVLLGYPDDEGVRLSGGRLGAKSGPDEIRRYLLRAVWPSFAKSPILDLGNLKSPLPLVDRHELAKSAVFDLLKANHFVIALGGSHDYGYADGAAFLESVSASRAKPLVINLDAHLDCRPDDKGANSGTPFFRLLEKYPKAFDLMTFGLQTICNAETYLEYAKKKRVKVFYADQKNQFLKSLKAATAKNRPVFLSLDIDVVSSAWATGSSNNWPFGISPMDLREVILMILNRSDVKVFSIYEVAPNLDPAATTQKLAAQMAYEVFCHIQKSAKRKSK